ncbi:hypothetical protein [Halorussus halobius]|nr:hypothetical protein [Halorussus halobius]
MKQALRIGLILTFLTALLLVGTTGALAGECMSIGDVTVNCACDNMCY